MGGCTQATLRNQSDSLCCCVPEGENVGHYRNFSVCNPHPAPPSPGNASQCSVRHYPADISFARGTLMVVPWIPATELAHHQRPLGSVASYLIYVDVKIPNDVIRQSRTRPIRTSLPNGSATKRYPCGSCLALVLRITLASYQSQPPAQRNTTACGMHCLMQRMGKACFVLLCVFFWFVLFVFFLSSFPPPPPFL